jgi:hypothetical protein
MGEITHFLALFEDSMNLIASQKCQEQRKCSVVPVTECPHPTID